MERKIGEVFEFGGEWYQAIDNKHGVMCSGCVFVNECNECIADRNIVGSCGCKADNKLIFKKLEKVGEPYMDGGKIMQKYNRVYREPIYFPYKELNCYNDLHGRICIEIKQTKEDMEENRTINQQFAECEQTINDVVRKCYTENKSTQIKDMEEYKIHDAKEDIPEFDKVVDECLFGKQELKLKPFDLQKAKAGKPVCTRDGRKARIICFDKRGKFPIIALIDEGDIEVHYYYSHNGKSADCVSDYDLMMLPEKKEGWVNVYKDSVYETKDDALIGRSESRGYIDTIKISWEE